MINLIYILLVTWIINPLSLDDNGTSKCKNSSYLVAKSQQYHDTENKWANITFNLHIQEPRLANPTRYSIIYLNNEVGSFSIERDSNYGKVVRSIDSSGVASITVNGSSSFSNRLRDELRLIESNIIRYKDFYKAIYGLPMSLNQMGGLVYSEAKSITFFEKEVFKINVTLEEGLISNNWNLYILQEDFSLFALEFVHKDKDNELLKFESVIDIEGVRIPRFRHWYNLVKEEYRGSDIIVKETGS